MINGRDNSFFSAALVHRGRSVAFSKDNLGCWGAIENLFGGPYIEDATVKLLVEIEKFKKDREHVNALQTINPKTKPTGKYAIFKPFSQLTEDDEPEIFCNFARIRRISLYKGSSKD